MLSSRPLYDRKQLTLKEKTKKHKTTSLDIHLETGCGLQRKQREVLAALSNVSTVPGLLIHHQYLTFSKTQFRMHLAEKLCFSSCANLMHTSWLLGVAWGADLLMVFYSLGKTWVKIGYTPNKSGV